MARQLNQPSLTPKKMAILLYLSGKALRGVLPYGDKAAATRAFLCRRETILAVWAKRDYPRGSTRATLPPLERAAIP
ncbi:hypothetical protein GN244_ATG06025 [Phytophthora infestans]|uniref:Uncharacterized protein n=1 Tax=Phytophthora infestans TaxID=4787 RepID=A0A833T169_PHYIN|nr:hypothetical protein GN244_ATG06025 [Phytophthora infestans]